MPRYAAFLRGVTPMNAKMPALRAAFEEAGFTDVKTVLGTGNVVFGARATSLSALEKKAERAMNDGLGRTFLTIVRPIDALHALLETDPYAEFRLAAGSKRIVTFLRSAPKAKPALPVELHGARILALQGAEAFTAYVPTPQGPVFMSLLQKTFGEDITTRTWDTVAKVAKASV